MKKLLFIALPNRSSTSGLRICVIGFVFSLFWVFACSTLPAKTLQDSPEFSDADIEFFESKVRPLLVNNCYECHGNDPEDLEGGLSVTSRKAILAGGDSGPAIVPGDPDESLVIQAINYDDVYEMPPSSKMAKVDIDILTEWVRRKAPWPADSDVAVAKKAFDWRALKKEHWCWQPIVKPPVPKVKDTDWPLDELDNFILAKLEKSSLSPANPADKRSLIRRAYFDLAGLPPEPSAIAEFENDSSPEAFAKVVDGLLSSPAFGERWARHWMDLVRYAETCGHEFDFPIPNAYRYRDYLIRSFNADVPFDQFMTEHIAGDLLEKPRRHPDEEYNESVIGTGFWFLHEAVHGPVDVKGDETGRIENQIDVLCKTFLGLTVACARCHDHKFDAISATDYYALAGFLQSSRRQLAMIDTGRKIEKAYKQHVSRTPEANRLLKQWLGKLADADSKKLEVNVAAAVEWLRQDPTWNQPLPHKIQGQSFKNHKATAGKVQVQRLKPEKNFRLAGNKQLWWRDGKPGDTLSIPFELPASLLDGETKVEISASLTYAHDYGIAKISLGENTLSEIDFYNKQLTNKKISLGAAELSPGKQVLKIEITGSHPDAAKRHMFSIDYLEVKPLTESVAEGIAIDEFAAKKKVDLKSLQNWVQMFQRPELAKPEHDLHFISRLTRSRNSFKKEKAGKRLRADVNAEIAKQNKLELFEDFANLDGWFSTGFAFENYWRESNGISLAGSAIAKQGIAHSGLDGKKLHGALRSPTFTLEHDQVHILCRGKNVFARLVIDGFEMDAFRALLFKGAKADINSPSQFTWLTLGEDVANYKGHRAFIEFVDHGDGFCELDEIRFSNKNDPKPELLPSRIAAASLAGNPKNAKQLARGFVKSLKRAAANSESTDVLLSLIHI